MLYHEAVSALRLVVFIEFVELDNLDELISILRIGGIASSLQSACPTFIICGLEIEETAITLAIDQETRVILIGLEDRVVGTETLIALVIVVIDRTSRPSVALDAEMIITLASKFTLPCSTLEKSLCERDRSGNFPAVHFLDGNILILVDILLITLIPANLCIRSE